MTLSDDDVSLPLFSRAPSLRATLPHIPLGRYPTPLESIDIAGRRILVKRDDITADGYGGNKVRKLEFLLGAARAAGARRVITAGATGSHHAFATAFHGSRHGFTATLVLFPQRLTPHVRDMLLLDDAVGAELRWVPRMEAVPYGMWRARLAHRAEQPYVVPPGGSNAIGSLGYVNAALELATQLDESSAAAPSRVHVAAGTMGTVAGLAIGLAWAGLDVPIVATRITSKLVANERVLQRLVHGCVRTLSDAGASPPEPAAALRLVDMRHDQIGTGYGHSTAAGEEAAQLFRRAGLALDSTYTAKAAAGLLSDDAPGVPLFWHTRSAHAPMELLEGHEPALPAQFADYLKGMESDVASR
jgi:1-aminocyclopropane-1-carboxylate deaminase/D-cysteine desulfhydrase-like pyridoxal-dependent ACC family enzyme